MKREERSRQVETLAQENGWSFSATGNVLAIEKFEFQTGEKRKVERIENIIEGADFKCFDVYWQHEFKASDAFGPFAYKNLTAQNARQQTFVLYESADLHLPKFHVYSTTSSGLIDSWLDKTFRRTDFSEYPKFEKRWTVLGDVKNLFSEKVVEFYEQSDEFWTFAVDNLIFIYQPDVLILLPQIADWAERISELGKLLEGK